MRAKWVIGFVGLIASINVFGHPFSCEKRNYLELHPYLSRPATCGRCLEWVKQCFWERYCVDWDPEICKGPYNAQYYHQPGFGEDNYCQRSHAMPVCRWTCVRVAPH